MENIINIIKTARNKAEAIKLLGWPNHSKSYKKLNVVIDTQQVDVSHFDVKYKLRQYESITKKCPICGTEFKTKKGHPREKTTCSYGCANTEFRSGPDHPNFGRYTSICFYYHKKKCLICGEENIVAAHHVDMNTENNDPSNLVPLCPTHHQYYHSRFRFMVEGKINNYLDEWKKKKITKNIAW